MPNVMKNQEQQMNLSLCYHATEIELDDVCSKEKVSIACDNPKLHLTVFTKTQLSYFRRLMSQTSVLITCLTAHKYT